jgi:hypothetical protein
MKQVTDICSTCLFEECNVDACEECKERNYVFYEPNNIKKLML